MPSQPAVRRLVYMVSSATFAVTLFAQATTASAQTGRESHWGVRVSGTPSWELAEPIRKVIFEDNETGTIQGSEFSIGFVRGSSLGGDWGVSYVRKPWDDGSGPVSATSDCFNQAQTVCRPRTESTSTKGVYLDAFEVHWFIRIVNIKRRVQLGANIAGGLGAMRGDVVKTENYYVPTTFNQQGQPTAFRAVQQTETIAAKDELLPYFPLAKVEALASVRVTAALKVQAAAGANFPASSARLGVVYLFGAR